MFEPSVDDLVDDSGLIFTGHVTKHAASTVHLLKARASFVVVQVDRGLRVDPALGVLSGRLVTVDTQTASALQVDDSAVFFTRSWIHGGGIAAREMARRPSELADQVAASVSRIPERQLAARLRAAELVVLGEVVEVHRLPFQIAPRDAPQWAAAALKVEKLLKGEASDSMTILFPTSERPIWTKSPRLHPRQRGVFLLHTPRPQAVLFALLPHGGTRFTVPLPADSQPESRAADIARLLAGGSLI